MTTQTTIAPDVSAEIGRWLDYLGAERRMSPKTLEAYERDVRQFLAFLAGHLGGVPSLKTLAKLTPADVRAFMASRRGSGAGNRTLMRGLAGTRSFARFLERDGKGKVGALAAIRAPKLARGLPKPLAVISASSSFSSSPDNNVGFHQTSVITLRRAKKVCSENYDARLDIFRHLPMSGTPGGLAVWTFVGPKCRSAASLQSRCHRSLCSTLR